MRQILWLALIGLGCAATSHPVAGPSAPTIDGGWRTLTAEHQATIEAPSGTLRLRALVAIERPDRFRLRALGPAGLTLFDILYRDGETRVVTAARLQGRLPAIADSMVGDLAAAFALTPAPPDRTTAVEGDELVVREAQRTVRLRRFVTVGRASAARQIEIENRAGRYKVHVEVEGLTLDPPLDPELFR